VLERCTESIAKHYLHFFANCTSTIENNIYKWSEVAKTREILPTGHENDELKNKVGRHDLNSKKLEQMNNVTSDESDASSTENNKNDIVSSINDNMSIPRFPVEMLSAKDETHTVTALFSYTATAENQLSFLEGDKLYLIGDDSNGKYWSSS
jgi:SH3 domain